MHTCQACETAVNASDRFCRNCGAPIAATFTDSIDTTKFANVSASEPRVSSGLTNPFYAPPSGGLAGRTSALLRRTVSLLAHRKLVWLALILFLLVAAPIGLSIGKSVVRAQRAERAERTREAARIKREREARKAEVAHRNFEQWVVNAMGFMPREVSPVEFPDVHGIFVSSLTNENSPAARAGFQAGDVLTKVNSQEINNEGDLVQLLDTLKPGAEVTAYLYRNGAAVPSQMRIGDKSLPPLQPKIETRDEGFLGIGDSSRRCCIPGSNKWGVEIRRIIDNSPADLAGLQLGDLITEFDKFPTVTPDEFARRIRLAKPRSKVKVKFYRGNVEQTVDLTLGHGW